MGIKLRQQDQSLWHLSLDTPEPWTCIPSRINTESLTFLRRGFITVDFIHRASWLVVKRAELACMKWSTSLNFSASTTFPIKGKHCYYSHSIYMRIRDSGLRVKLLEQWRRPWTLFQESKRVVWSCRQCAWTNVLLFYLSSLISRRRIPLAPRSNKDANTYRYILFNLCPEGNIPLTREKRFSVTESNPKTPPPKSFTKVGWHSPGVGPAA